MRILFYIFAYLLISSQTVGQSTSGYLSNDGTWCWFSDPRAILVDDYIFTGWVKSDGTIEVVKFEMSTGKIQTDELYYKLEADDHDNPAFVPTQGGQILALYTRHSRKDLFINRLIDYRKDSIFTEAQLIHPISSEELEKFPRETMTYANPFQLKGENNRIYCFGRWTGFKPNVMWSDNEGESWTKGKVLITNYPFDSNNRPYVKYFSDGISKIHIIFTDGHPRDEPTNSVYYAFYENNKFFKVDGSPICGMNDIPFEPKDASTIFKSNEEEGRSWIADVGQDQNGNPVILYTKSPEETDHRYWYARYIDGKWVNYEISKSGKWFPHTPEGEKEREPHYFGGMTVHPDKANVVYLSRQVNGIFEIERWETKDFGNTWVTEIITKDSEYDNVRPYVPRGLKANQDEVVLWMENQEYIHYTKFKTSIKYHIRKAK